MKVVFPEALEILSDGYAVVSLSNRPLAARTGLNFLNPGITENSALMQMVEEETTEAAFGDESGI